MIVAQPSNPCRIVLKSLDVCSSVDISTPANMGRNGCCSRVGAAMWTEDCACNDKSALRDFTDAEGFVCCLMP
jgi:hypothetical protein